MKKRFLAALCGAVIFSSCVSSGGGDHRDSLAISPIVGEWTNTYLEVVMPSVNGSDSIDTLIVDQLNWEEKLQIKPIRTFYSADGTYHSEHRDLNDSLVYDPAGKWFISGDSLSMMDTFPAKGLKYSYKIKVSGNSIEFWGIEDFDQDGEADDRYYGRQIRN